MAPMFRAAAVAAALAGTTLISAPAAAAPLASVPALGAPSAVFDASRYDPAAATAGWRCRGWRCGWGRWGGGWGRRGWRRNRIDGGDVLIGAAIIGGAIAIANANNRRQRERDVVIVERDADFRDRDDWNRDRTWDRRDDRRRGPRSASASGLDNAVNMCLDRIERDVRVETVDNVERTGAGWRVSGALFDGSPFRCRIGNDGRIDGIDFSGGFSDIGLSDGEPAPAVVLPRGAGQWSDAGYAGARAALGGTVRPDLAVGEAPPAGEQAARPRTAAASAMPAYPGGPVPGEVIPETIDGDIDG